MTKMPVDTVLVLAGMVGDRRGASGRLAITDGTKLQ